MMNYQDDLDTLASQWQVYLETLASIFKEIGFNSGTTYYESSFLLTKVQYSLSQLIGLLSLADKLIPAAC